MSDTRREHALINGAEIAKALRRHLANSPDEPIVPRFAKSIADVLEVLTAPIVPPPDDDPTRYLEAELHKAAKAFRIGADGLDAETNSRDYGEALNRLNETKWALEQAYVTLEKLKGTWLPGGQTSAVGYEETEYIKSWALANTKTLPLTREQYERAMAEHPSRPGTRHVVESAIARSKDHTGTWDGDRKGRT